jgi:hypothetical protein
VDESATIVLGDAQDARGAHGAIGHVQRVPVLCPVVASLKHAGRAVVSGSVSSAELKEGRCTAARASISRQARAVVVIRGVSVEFGERRWHYWRRVNLEIRHDIRRARVSRRTGRNRPLHEGVSIDRC